MTVFEPVIGIEVHAQLLTKTKLFCACANAFGDGPNVHTCPVCLGLPGALPVLNKKAVELAMMAGLALNCSIQHTSEFARKNYFYPDLPKGYQISQFDAPICLNGHIDIDVNGKKKRIGITRIHIEEDAGKLVHQGAEAIAGSTHSWVDLNRASVPLIEIVSEPDLRSPEEAKAYMMALHLLLKYLGICDGNLDQGSMRADANVSIRPMGASDFCTRTEIKNLNSFRSLERAIVSEINRQTQVVNAGQKIIQQTRNYDDTTQTTSPLRSKEEAHDYRYFPDPDLIRLVVDDLSITAIAQAMPELPQQKKERFVSTWQLSPDDANVLIHCMDMLRYFEEAVALDARVSPKEICKWVVGDLNALLKESPQGFAQTRLSPAHLVSLIALIQAGDISGKIAKQLLEPMISSGKMPQILVQDMGLSQVSDVAALQEVIQLVLANNEETVQKIKAGKSNSIDFLIGQVMKHTKGKAKPDLVRSLLQDALA